MASARAGCSWRGRNSVKLRARQWADGRSSDMPDETRHESSDLTDYEVQEPADSLEPDQGDDPLDRGVAPPERWSAGMRFGTTAGEEEAGESLDRALAEEEPDITFDPDDEPPEDLGGDYDAADEYIVSAQILRR